MQKPELALDSATASTIGSAAFFGRQRLYCGSCEAGEMHGAKTQQQSGSGAVSIGDSCQYFAMLDSLRPVVPAQALHSSRPRSFVACKLTISERSIGHCGQWIAILMINIPAPGYPHAPRRVEWTANTVSRHAEINLVLPVTSSPSPTRLPEDTGRAQKQKRRN